MLYFLMSQSFMRNIQILFGNEYLIENLVEKMGKHYNTKFNFDNKFLYFPLFKKDGKYIEMQFQMNIFESRIQKLNEIINLA